jgi:hypothetical protein
MDQHQRDDWWRKQFSSLLATEEQGGDPSRLITRWLLLASRTWGGRRCSVSFDVPMPVYRLLDDADVRARDAGYALKQWAVAREWIDG